MTTNNSNANQLCIVVIGAGVVGLSTAINIQRQLPSAMVTILAEHFTIDTTSDGAHGILVPPGPSDCDSLKRVRSWVKHSFDFMSQLAVTENGPQAGVFNLSGYLLANSKSATAAIDGLVYDCHEVDLDVVGHQFNQWHPNVKYAFFVSTVVAEGRKYLPFLTKMFLSGGGKLCKQRVETFEELRGRYDVIVNCSGLGSRKLANDASVFPARGQLIRVKAPWIKQFLYAPAGVVSEDYQLAILPGIDNVVLGGCYQPGKDDPHVSIRDHKAIMDGVTKIAPSLKKAEVVREWVGLRPCRHGGIRLDVERRPTGAPIVHNYGHSTSGMGLSWGTAVEAARMVKDLVKGAKL